MEARDKKERVILTTAVMACVISLIIMFAVLYLYDGESTVTVTLNK